MINHTHGSITGLGFGDDNEDDFELVCFQGDRYGRRRLKEGEYTRYRNYPITVRMTQEEKQQMEKCFEQSGFRKKQSYIIHALCQKSMATDNELSAMKDILKNLDDIYEQLREMKISIDRTDGVTEQEELLRLIATFRKEVDVQWQSIKYLLQKLQATQH